MESLGVIILLLFVLYSINSMFKLVQKKQDEQIELTKELLDEIKKLNQRSP